MTRRLLENFASGQIFCENLWREKERVQNNETWMIVFFFFFLAFVLRDHGSSP